MNPESQVSPFWSFHKSIFPEWFAGVLKFKDNSFDELIHMLVFGCFNIPKGLREAWAYIADMNDSNHHLI